MDDLKNTIQHLLSSNMALKKAYQLYYLNIKWSEIVNRDIADKTFIERISRSVLYVLTCSSVWSNQLSFLKPQLLVKMRENLKIEDIRDIKFSTTSLQEIQRLKLEIIGSEFGEEAFVINEQDREYLEQQEIPWDNEQGIAEDLHGKLQRIYQKDKFLKLHKEQIGWKPCIICGGLVKTDNKVCSICFSKIQKEKHSRIIQYLKEVPWANYRDFQLNNKNISEQEFINVKEDYKEQLKEGIYKKTGLYVKEYSKDYKEYVKKELINYVMLATSLQPQFINEEIIKKKIGRRVFNILYEVGN